MEAVYDIQDSFHRSVQNRFLQAAFFYGIHDLLVIDAAGCGHLQIQSCFQIGYSVVHRTPVAYHEAIKAPFPAEDICQGFFMLSSIGAVDLIIRTHNSPGLLAAHRALKSRQVNFTQRSFIHFGGGRHPARLLVICQKMLDACSHVFALYALDQRACHLRSNHGVFRIILEIPSAERGTFDIYGRPKNNANALRLAFLTQHLAHAGYQFPVEAGRRTAARRKANRLNAVVNPQMIRFLILFPESVRAVGNHHGRNSQPFHTLRMPEVRS